jgi:23S rRNA (cytidine1920-2'-O)/16S rRNA (cytidine1409-2'-O)-methyltransferase
VSPTVTNARRIRLDQLLVERGLAANRSRAQALLLSARVRVGEGDAARADRKPGDLVDPATAVRLVERDPFVSRGGHKLAAALDAFRIEPAGLVCLDVGASTGGFTDVLLQRGAARVYALDVGRGQLAETLRADPRVVSMERTNARTLGPAVLPEPVALAVVDVSFISLARVLGPIAGCFEQLAGGPIVALVKPQFEAGRGRTQGGVVRDPAIHREVLDRVARGAAAQGLRPRGVIASPLLGAEGNREFLLHLDVPPGWASVPARDAAQAFGLPDDWASRLAEVVPG